MQVLQCSSRSYLVKLKINRNDDDRKYNSKHVYQTRINLTTDLSRKDMNEKTKSSVDHSYNRLYSSIQQILVSEGAGGEEGGDDEAEIDEDEAMRSVRAVNNEEDGSGGEDDENGDSNENDAASAPESASPLTQDGSRIRWKKPHKYMLVNLEPKGWDVIQSMDLKEVRTLRRQRAARLRQVNMEIANHIKEEQRIGISEVGQEVNNVRQPWRNIVTRTRSDFHGDMLPR